MSSNSFSTQTSPVIFLYLIAFFTLPYGFCVMHTHFCIAPKSKGNHVQNSGTSFLYDSLLFIPGPQFPATLAAQSYDICLLCPVRHLHPAGAPCPTPTLPFAECLQVEACITVILRLPCSPWGSQICVAYSLTSKNNHFLYFVQFYSCLWWED